MTDTKDKAMTDKEIVALKERIEQAAEVVIYDHETRSEYLTDAEKELIIYCINYRYSPYRHEEPTRLTTPRAPLAGEIKRIALAAILLDRDEGGGCMSWAEKFITDSMHADHDGDCTNKSHACNRCQADHVLKDADRILAALRSAQARAPVSITEEQIKHMVDRFLGWHLPANFKPDAGISFKAEFNEHTPHPMRHEPTGTNLFDADQATAMVRYMLEGLPQG